MNQNTQEIMSAVGMAYLRSMPIRVLKDEIKRRTREDDENQMIEEGMEIYAWLCQQLHVDPIQMNSAWRPAWLSDKRAIAIYVAHKASGMSLVNTGRLFNRDHASVIHSRKKVAARPDLMEQAAHLLKTWEGVQP